jgi:hypothetical protein
MKKITKIAEVIGLLMLGFFVGFAALGILIQSGVLCLLFNTDYFCSQF